MGKTAAGLLRAPLLCGAVLALFLIGPAGAGADAGSLYQGPGPRPGPDILYEPLADAPQLQNAGDWSAPPILVSGASAYRDGEFLYQDFLYDDSGAIGSPVQNDPALLRQRVLPPDRDLHLSDQHGVREQRGRHRRAAGRAARDRDRVPDHAQHAQARRRGPRRAPRSRSATRSLPRPFPHGANVSAPAQLFLTVHGSTADLLDAATRPAGWSVPAVGQPRHDAPPDHGAGAALELGPDRPGRAPRGRRRAVEHRAEQLPDPVEQPERDAGRRRERPSERAGVLQRRLPLQRADAGHPEPQRGQRSGLVARQRAGARAHDRRHQPVLRERRLQQARRAGRRRHAGPAGRSSADGPDEPHPREPLRDRAGRRLQLLGQPSGFGCSSSTTTTTAARAGTADSCSPTRSTSPSSRCRRTATG